MYTSFLPEHLNLKFAITANVKITSQDSPGPGYYGHGSLQEVVTMVTLTLYELHDIASQLLSFAFLMSFLSFLSWCYIEAL